MVLSLEDRAELAALFGKLTPSHVSTIVASLSEPGSLIGTVKESANYAFLQKMAALGLAAEVPLPEDLDGEVRASATAFTLSAEAGPEIEHLLNNRAPERRRTLAARLRHGLTWLGFRRG